MKYLYHEEGQIEERSKPKLGKQYGFFATKKDDSYGEVIWNDEYYRRSRNRQELFGWLHDNIFLPEWGDISIKIINYTNRV